MYQLDLPCVGWHDYGTLLLLFYSFDYDLIFHIIKNPERIMQKAREGLEFAREKQIAPSGFLYSLLGKMKCKPKRLMRNQGDLLP